ncbi:zdhhc15 [Nucleospora cyclopteri]
MDNNGFQNFRLFIYKIFLLICYYFYFEYMTKYSPTMDKKIFYKEIIKLLKFAIYPTIELYGYFVFLGIFCLQDNSYPGWAILVLFLIYHLILTFKIILFMQLYITEGISTIELFPHISKATKKEKYEFLNPFVRENILQNNVEKSQYCDICNTIKPPRSHHCSKCNRCILKFDHHCDILETCIGFHNYKFFVQFLVFNFTNAVFFVSVISVDLVKRYDDSVSLQINYIISLSLFLIEAIVTILFIVFHFRLLARNETTVEYLAINAYLKGDHSYVHVFQEGPMKNFSESKDRKVLNPYNIDLKYNIQSVFGRNLAETFSPTFTSLGNGLNFKTNEQENWETQEL